jgi:hypothetical protein
VTKRKLVERIRWLVFYFATKSIAIAGLILSLILICISIYGLLSGESGQQRTGAVLGIPSIILFIYTIRLFRLSNISSEDVNKWYPGKKKQ